MPVPSSFSDLDTTATNNSPPGTESAKGNIDNYLRAAFAFIKQLYTNPLQGLGTTGAQTAAQARTTLGSTATGDAVFTAASASAARSTLGVPATDGTNATGTWGISISGNAATATSATSASSATSATTATKLSTTSGSAPVYGCRAFGYVTNNGTTASLTAGGNIASVSRAAVGEVAITFTTAMPNANYSVVGMGSNTAIVNGSRSAFLKDGSKTTSGFTMYTVYDGAPTAGQDCNFDFVVFG